MNMDVKSRNLQNIKVTNANANWIFPVPFKVEVYIIWKNAAGNRSGYLRRLNQNFPNKCRYFSEIMLSKSTLKYLVY